MANIDKEVIDNISDEETRKIVAWFGERYEDPANGVPHESREGGYQYMHDDEPFSADEVLAEQFGDAVDEEALDSAIAIINDNGTEWVPKGRY